ncbi:P-loop containing nucleoside triphosphate hydrolase protein [Calycina marina]|uniref:P-loop containing nucleoside triphosphate hydrolase protein n=1 Tax=Calycina marina TaxID=1763456 RepID=A0A9P7ZAA2_9HELO|nr:P-loop containing nucleoside triphosphate hydrolase protein [Calycina marina]
MESIPSNCVLSADNSFGPAVKGCRDGFDFTLLFEEIALAIIPLVILLVSVPFRLFYIWRDGKRAKPGILLPIKLSLLVVFSGLQLALVILWSRTSAFKTRLSIPTATSTFVASVSLCVLSYTEHVYRLRPSSILTGYFLFTILFDAARVRTLWLMHHHELISILSTASVGMKVLLLLSEMKEKRSVLRSGGDYYPPESLSGLINASLFWWLNPLLHKGSSNELGLDDLYPVDDDMLAASLESRLEHAWKLAPQSSSNSLLATTAGVLKWTILSALLPRLALIALKFSQPFMVAQVIRYVGGPKYQSNNAGYGLIGAYVLVYTGIAICTGRYQHLTYRLITMTRGALISLIYRKTLQLKLTALGDSKPVTLMSTDVQRIASGLEFMHDAWAAFIEVPIALWLLQRQLGLGFLSPIFVAFVSAAIVARLGGLVGARQSVWLQAIEKRIGVTVSVLQSMKGVKMTGMTEWLTVAVQNLRIAELQQSKKFRELLVGALTLSFTTSTISPVIAFGIYMGIAIRKRDGSTLEADRAFEALSLFALLFQPMLQVLQAIPSLMSAVGAFVRIQEFMVSEAWEDPRYLNRLTEVNIDVVIDEKRLSVFGITGMRDSLILGEKPKPRNTKNSIQLKNVSFGWNKADGPVLENLNLTCAAGSLTMIVGPVGSGKSTLLFGLLGETPTSSGELEMSTSSFAYCGQAPWVTNSTLRQNIIRFLPFDEVWYNRVLRACALEQDLKSYTNGDQTVIGNSGSLLSGGQKQRVALARAVYSRQQIFILDDVFSGLDPRTEEHVFNAVFGRRGLLRKSKATIILATHAAYLLCHSDYVVALGDDGDISQQGTFEELQKAPGYVRGLNINPPTGLSSKKVAMPRTDSGGAREVPATVIETELGVSNLARQTGDLSIYAYYFKTIGWRLSMFFLLAVVGFAFCNTFPSIWVQWWTRSNEHTPHGRLGYYLGIYTLLSVATLLCLAVGCWNLMAYMVPRSANKLHLILLSTVMKAPISFSSNIDVGITSNRFSQDMELIDMELPLGLLNASSAFFMAIAQVALIASSTKYLAAGIPLVGIVFFFIQRFYLRTSRQVRFLDLEAKSPLYTNFLETLNGLASIRCFGLEEEYKQKNETCLNASQSPFYLLYSIQRWLSVVLDLVVAGVAVSLVMMAVFLRTHMSPGLLGVGLLNIISLGESLKGLITDWTKLETSIGAVARVRAFEIETENENRPEEVERVLESWPAYGNIFIDNVAASYGNSPSKLSLKGVTMSIKHGQKIGVCGRSGSGKSSLVSCLFRLMEMVDGTITIDGVDISKIPRQVLRSRLVALPQEPFFWADTVRRNIDPNGEYSDVYLLATIERVQLRKVIETKGGLDAIMDSELLSQGQRQLLCLARAMLRNSTVLVLDEATSSVDVKTNEVIQRIIREEFKDYTIIAVAHQLNTIVDFDKVAVLDAGRLIEFDAPMKLLRQQSMFRELWEAYEGGTGN